MLSFLTGFTRVPLILLSIGERVSNVLSNAILDDALIVYKEMINKRENKNWVIFTFMYQISSADINENMFEDISPELIEKFKLSFN